MIVLLFIESRRNLKQNALDGRFDLYVGLIISVHPLPRFEPGPLRYSESIILLGHGDEEEAK